MAKLSKSKRKWLIGSGIAIAVVVTFVAIGLVEQGRDQARLAQARSAAKQAGAILTLDEFRSEFPAPREEDNAWPIYLKTIRLYRPLFGSEDPTDRFAPPNDRESSMTPILQSIAWWNNGVQNWRPRGSARQAFASFADVIEAAKELPDYKSLHFESRFDLGLASDYQEAIYILNLASLFMFDFLVAIDGAELDRAKEALEVMSAMAQHLRQIPAWQAQYAAMAVSSQAMAAAKWSLNSQSWPLDRLEELELALAPVLEAPDLKQVFRGVLFRGLVSLETFSSAPNMREAGLGRRARFRSAPRPGLREECEMVWLATGAEILRDWPEGEDYLALQRIIEPRQEALAGAMQTYNTYLGNRADVIRPITETITMAQSHVAKSRIVMALFAALKALRDKGAAPNEIPLSGNDRVDPFSNEPLRYKGDSQALTIYSVGVNSIDDAGSAVMDGPHPKDWVVRYPELRTGW